MTRIAQKVLIAGLLAVTTAWSVAAVQDPPGSPQVTRPNNPQGRPPRGQGLPAPAPGMPLQQMQAMFDAYVLVQAQKVLQLNDEQYQRFFTRMNRLQDLRRQHAQQRMRRLNELRKLWRLMEGGEAQIAAQTKALDEMDEKFDNDVRAARLAIDESLTVRQRAGFRFFEEEMDRQKIEFLTKARQR